MMPWFSAVFFSPALSNVTLMTLPYKKCGERRGNSVGSYPMWRLLGGLSPGTIRGWHPWTLLESRNTQHREEIDILHGAERVALIDGNWSKRLTPVIHSR
ncbi:hypothetical protein BDV29DRAFT_27005 [Aspergillus leporis]|uniref:Secreted protein n=1 Tax=Aspergillus leporis TaxID=41062 RepID=A0A5N5WQP2_9EURO|nr:hypothetical protein BDV29DRAFT_27005 [Aspergillus leporis]